MKIEAGKYYKTRDGRKAFVAAEVPPDPFSGLVPKQPFRGYIKGADGPHCFTANGGFWSSGDPFYGDLIAEWVEPPTPLEVCKELVKTCKGWELMTQFKAVVDKAEQAISAAEGK